MTERLKLFNSKRKLYFELMQIRPDVMTEDDVNLLYQLRIDKEIHDYLRDDLNKESNEQ